MDEQAFSELVALTSLLPGPTSSQLGIAIGSRRAGPVGGLAAWFGFTLPSAVAMTVLALTVGAADVGSAGWVHGLELVAAPVVAIAVLAMYRTLARGPLRLAVAALATVVALAVGGFGGQAAALGLGGVVGILAFRQASERIRPNRLGRSRRALATACAAALATLLVGSPLVSDGDRHGIELGNAMVRSGSLVFGGGHVVLPLLHEAVVAPGWVGEQEFLAGYGLAQAMPGPLFAFSAYLGAIEDPSPSGVPGAALALVAIFAPSFLLLGAALPIWSATRNAVVVRSALAGVSAAVVGLLAAALWDPVLTSTVDGVGDAVFALALLPLFRLLPPWAVVPLAAGAGQLAF